MVAEAWLVRLKENGYRLTAARRAVVDVIQKSRYALTPVQVFDMARKKYAALGLVTVYRTLEKLEELHLIQRVHQPQGCQAFVSASHGHEHLLLCQNCGQITFFEGDDLDALITVISKKTGYQIHDHWLQLFGFCQTCK
jgi:Fe2+ or Zn2+ uptake regulation protein